MESELSSLDLECQWIEAIDGRSFLDKDRIRLADLRYQRLNNSRLFTPNEIGCSLSHLKAYSEIVEQGLASGIVLEDDVILDQEFKSYVVRIERELSTTQPEIILLNQIKAYFDDSLQTVINRQLVEVASGRLTWGYMINAQAAEAILKKNTPVKFLSDDWKRIRYYCGCQIRAVVPPLVTADLTDFVSDIGGPSAKKPKRKSISTSRLFRIGLQFSRFRRRLFRKVRFVDRSQTILIKPIGPNSVN